MLRYISRKIGFDEKTADDDATNSRYHKKIKCIKTKKKN